MMRRLATRRLWLLLWWVLLLSLVGCKREVEPEGVEAAAGPLQLRVAVREPGSLDPAFLGSSQDFLLAHQLHLSLFRWGDEAGKVVPALARSWEVSPDGLVWTFELADGYRFSDGSAVEARHVEGAWRRLLDPKVASPGADALKFLKGGLGGANSVRAQGAGRLVVELQRPLPWLPQVLASPRFAAVSDEILKRPEVDHSKLESGMVTSGPYQLGAWRPREGCSLRPSGQWPGSGRWGGVELLFAESEDAAMTWWRSKSVDLVVGLVPMAKVGELAKTSPESVATFPLRSVYYLIPNVQRRALSDADVRVSMAKSLERDRLVTRVLGAGQLPARGFLPPGYGDSLGLKHVECFDRMAEPVKLSEATLKQLSGMELLCNSGETHKLIIEYLHSNLVEQLGLDLRLSLLEWNSYLNVASRHDFDIMRMSFTGSDDPLDILENFATGNRNNYGGYSSAEYDAVLSRARQEANPERRLAHLVEAQEILCRDMPALPVYVSSQVYLLGRGLKARLKPSQDGWFSLEYLSGGGAANP